MAPKRAQNRIKELKEQGVSLLQARAILKSEGFTTSRVSQLLKDYVPDEMPDQPMEAVESDAAYEGDESEVFAPKELLFAFGKWISYTQSFFRFLVSCIGKGFVGEWIRCRIIVFEFQLLDFIQYVWRRF